MSETDERHGSERAGYPPWYEDGEAIERRRGYQMTETKLNITVEELAGWLLPHFNPDITIGAFGGF